MHIAQRARRIEPFYAMAMTKAASALARGLAHTARPEVFLNGHVATAHFVRLCTALERLKAWLKP